MTTHLVIPDAHCTPDVDNDRFSWLGNAILNRRPDVIVCLGDMADMASLCSYDKGKKDFEGRRYRADVSCTRDALRRINEPIELYNTQRRKNGKAQYKPRKILTIGNHEDRINRVTQMQPELDGTISINDLGYKEAGWEVHPYRTQIEVDGVWYTHCIMTKMGYAVSGDNIGTLLLNKQHVTTVVGHSHIFDHSIRALPSKNILHGVSAGCYFNHELDFAMGSSDGWWRGLLWLHDVSQGNFDMETMSLHRVKELYSGTVDL